jgi:hypothetical protein
MQLLATNEGDRSMSKATKPGPPVYFYLEKAPNSFSKFLMFHNYSPNQMILEIYGLDGNKANMTHAFHGKIVTEEELSTVDFKWPEAVRIEKPIDHVTCHQDGKFHIKTTNKKDLYVERMKHAKRIGPDVDIFLQFKLVSEICERYSTVQLPLEEPNACFSVPQEQVLHMEGFFSGVRYNLEQAFSATVMHRTGIRTVITPVVQLISGSIKGLFHCYASPIPIESSRSKPDGTFMTFKFKGGEGKYAIKGFFFK